MFTDRVSAAQFINQTHDHNPGITREGLFWTLLIAPETTAWSAKHAEMCANDLWLPDMGDFGNAIVRGPMTPSTVNYHALWHAHATQPDELHDPVNRFRFLHRLADGLVTWDASEPGVTFRSVMTETPQETLYAAIGIERNGQFFT